MTDPRLSAALSALPLVAILRGIQPEEVVPIGSALYDEGFRIVEVPLNSPRAVESVRLLRLTLPADALTGAGTVVTPRSVQEVSGAGGQIIVTPNVDVKVIEAAKRLGMLCIAGFTTPTEAFSAIEAGADALKLFPAELISPAVLRALRAVLPKQMPIIPVGGITPANMGPYREAGATGFGFSSSLFSIGMDAEGVRAKAKSFADAWRG